jgi:heptosyltransferase-2
VAENVLLIAPTWVGDSIFITPAVKALKRAMQGARFTLLARQGICDLHAANPLYDRFVERVPGGYVSRFLQQRSLKKEKFDLALIFPDSFSSALGAWLTGASSRIGRGGQGRKLLLDKVLPAADRQRHVADEYMDLAEAAGAQAHPADRQAELPLTQQGIEEANRLFREAGIESSAALVGLCPTNAFGPSKAWPVKHWARLIVRLRERRFKPVMFGAASESAALREIDAASGGGTPLLFPGLPGLAAGLARMAAVVANDSGPLHVAAAVGARCLGLYGPVDPRWSAPLTLTAKNMYRGEDCSPCHQKLCPLGHHDCLEKISPEEVDTELDLLMKMGPR